MAGRKARVVVVDDDEAVRAALTQLLQLHSYEVRSFGAAAEFLESLSSDVPDCLVLDIFMPEFGGLDVLHYLQRNVIAIPTVVVTAQGEEGLHDRCRNAGAAAVLVKPVLSDIFFQAIESAMRNTAKHGPHA
jgi:FixJ family two-component response regulator